jgi:hypothetical protein
MLVHEFEKRAYLPDSTSANTMPILVVPRAECTAARLEECVIFSSTRVM